MSLPPFTPAPAYRREHQLLRDQGLASWEAVAALTLDQIRHLSRRSPGSESRLIRLRGQAGLMVALNLAPQEAALLLHAGVADPRALATADPHSLHRQVGRLQRRLTGTAMAPIGLETVHGWIRRAATAAGRPRN